MGMDAGSLVDWAGGTQKFSSDSFHFLGEIRSIASDQKGGDKMKA